MNSYPIEFLAHHVPLMFVAGLESSETTLSQGPGPLSPGKDAPEPMTGSQSGPIGRLRSESLISDVQERPRLDSTAGSHEDRPASASRENTADQFKETDDFEILKNNLRATFAEQTSTPKVWPSHIKSDVRDKINQSHQTTGMWAWRTLLVNKSVRLPPRKAVPQSSVSPAQNTAVPPHFVHSPSSPLTPGSITYPDGLITPTWVRKHSDFVPSVFVLFLRLYEHRNDAPIEQTGAQTTRGRTRSGSMMLDATDPINVPVPGTPQPDIPVSPNSAKNKRLQEERTADEKLVIEISERRKQLLAAAPVTSTSPGIKLTVVLMASREALDDSELDPRLSFIRRQSGLDTRASLFVLTPVQDDELGEFVASLREALTEPSQEYYSSHFKRNRRKRSRLPSNPNQLPYPLPTPPSAGTKPLSALGWTVRYDYKAGVFAEFRGELEAAQRLYEDTWFNLVGLFSSTTVMPPRTKRWAEAKVLADCVALKICRLHLYKQETSAALGFFQQHLSKFGELSRLWGIGGDTFEFWAWVSRQYRMFGELLELAVAAGLHIPVSLPSYMAVDSHMMSPGGTQLAENVLVSTTTPLTTLQHPGYYFYTAANCTAQRKEKFALMNESIGSHANIPGFANEQKVDHTGLIIELFTKAYSHFKQFEGGQTRMSLFIAYRIAESYKEAGKDELVLKYCEKIVTPYMRENWPSMVSSLRSVWYTAAQRVGAVEVAARLLLEMMFLGVNNALQPSEAGDIQDDLQALLSTTKPSTEDGIDISLPHQDVPMVSASFVRDSARVGETVGVIIEIHIPPDAPIRGIEIADIKVEFTQDQPPLSVSHKEVTDISDSILLSGAKSKTPATGNLTLSANRRIRLIGQVDASTIGSLEVKDVILSIKTSSWTIRLHSGGQLPVVCKMGPKHAYKSLTVSKTSPRVGIDLVIPHTIYRCEAAKVLCRIQNQESQVVKLDLITSLGDIEAQQHALSDITSTIRIGGQEGTGRSAKSSLGDIEPGETLEIPLYITSQHVSSQVLFVAVQDRALQGGPEETLENIKTVSKSISCIEPLDIKLETWFSPTKATNATEGAGPLEAADAVATRAEISASFQIKMSGDKSIHVKGIDVKHTGSDASGVQVVFSGFETLKDEYPQTWKCGDTFTLFNSYLATSTDRKQIDKFAGTLDVKWSFGQEDVETFHTVKPFHLEFDMFPYLSCIVTPPTQTSLGQPFKFELAIINAHPVLATSNLVVQLEASKAYAWSDQRQLALPVIKPRERWSYQYETTAIAGTGWLPLPRFLIFCDDNGMRRELQVRDGRDTSRAQPNNSGLSVFVRP